MTRDRIPGCVGMVHLFRFVFVGTVLLSLVKRFSVAGATVLVKPLEPRPSAGLTGAPESLPKWQDRKDTPQRAVFATWLIKRINGNPDAMVHFLHNLRDEPDPGPTS